MVSDAFSLLRCPPSFTFTDVRSLEELLSAIPVPNFKPGGGIFRTTGVEDSCLGVELTRTHVRGLLPQR